MEPVNEEMGAPVPDHDHGGQVLCLLQLSDIVRVHAVYPHLEAEVNLKAIEADGDFGHGSGSSGCLRCSLFIT
jgi:hypothetical protein